MSEEEKKGYQRWANVRPSSARGVDPEAVVRGAASLAEAVAGLEEKEKQEGEGVTGVVSVEELKAGEKERQVAAEEKYGRPARTPTSMGHPEAEERGE